MSIKTGKKLGFIASLTMLIGSVVGIGIFFKSHGVLKANDWNGTGAFLAWLLGGLLSLSAAVSFSEISSLKTKNVHGLAAWAEVTGGKKLGYFTRFNFSFFYYGLLASVLGVFGSEMVFNIIIALSNEKYVMGDFPVYTHIILGFIFIIFFHATNYFSIRASGIIATVSTILKWVPLILVALLGILFATTNFSGPLERKDLLHHYGENAFSNGQSFSFVGMLAALPAVLFAFDSFLGVASMRNKMEEPKKLPAVVLVGMISVLILYIFIALAAILHGSGMVSGLPFGAKGKDGMGIFDQIFQPSQAMIIGKFVIIFIAISTFGVMSGISAAAIATHEQAIQTNSIFGAKTLRAKFGDKKVILGYTLFVTLFWTAAFGIPAIIFNSDSIVDGMSNFPTLFFFAIYALVILLYTVRRDSFKTTKTNTILFKTFAWIAIVGIVFVVGYQLTYGFLINAILNPAETTHWGLFAGDVATDGKVFPTKFDVAQGQGVEMTLAQSSIVMFALSAVFFIAPTINLLLTRKYENNNVIVETQKEIKVTNT